jgi:hypothetical protein
MSEQKLKWSVPDHTGFLHPEKAKKGELEDLFQQPLTKYNQCHGAKGQFCSGGGGSSGGKGGGGGAPAAGSSKELVEHPPVPGARVKLAPLVGQQVTINYWVEKPGRTGSDRCIRDIKVEGHPIEYGHIWAQKAPKEVMKAKYGQPQKALGTVYRYKKKTGWDWAIGDLKGVTNKAEPLHKYNHCHGASGQFCSSGGSGGKGSGGGGGVGEEPFKQTAGLNSEEYNAVRQYGYTEYAFVNSYLRNKDTDQMPDKYKDLTKNLDSAIAKQPDLPADSKLYRGFKFGDAFGKKKPEELVGTVITDNGFMSTSTARAVAERFGSTRVTMSVPPGIKGLDMLTVKNTNAAQVEREIILPRGTRFEITKVTQTKGGFLGTGKKTDIEARILPSTEKSIQKYNHCHGASGQFCSSGGSGGKGGGGGSFQNTSGDLTPAEQGAVDSYASVGFKAMNNALRGKEPMTPELEQQVAHIDAAMAKNPLTKPETVFRGIKSTNFLGGETDPNKIRGMTIVDKGFMSTSANAEAAAGFSVGKGGVNMTIHAPKGLHALDIRNHIFTDQAFEEHEILLPRNTKLKITRAEQQGSQLRLTAEVV